MNDYRGYLMQIIGLLYTILGRVSEPSTCTSVPSTGVGVLLAIGLGHVALGVVIVVLDLGKEKP